MKLNLVLTYSLCCVHFQGSNNYVSDNSQMKKSDQENGKMPNSYISLACGDLKPDSEKEKIEERGKFTLVNFSLIT